MVVTYFNIYLFFSVLCVTLHFTPWRIYTKIQHMKKLVLSQPSIGKSTSRSLIEFAAAINVFSNKLFEEKLYSNDTFVKAVFGNETAIGLLKYGFDKWFLRLNDNDRLLFCTKVMETTEVDMLDFKIAIEMLVDNLVAQGISFHDFVMSYQQYYADFYYLDSEYLVYISNVLHSKQESLKILSK